MDRVTLWENLFSVLLLIMLIPAIWLSQTHAYLVLAKTAWMQEVEAAELRVVEDVTHGVAIPQTVQEAGRLFEVHLTQGPDSQSAACQDQSVALQAAGQPVQSIIIPKCGTGIFAS
ncbi:hypothetical protein [Alicyclobacillus fructus]|uniref:hypothetical protein n=1 Tax=Alicyclobacillus fructus TaxID=2816082 RepID=UPI001F250DD6|nr:hypothetical protein [Alicyclobacillus fructus]